MKKTVKLIALILTIAVLAAFTAGCGGESSSEPESSESSLGGYVIGPQQVASVDELNRQVGCSIVKPEGFEITDEYYSVLQTEPLGAEVQFKIDGCAYCYRACPTQDDLTGVYLEDGVLGDTVKAGTQVIPTPVVTGGFWARWYVGEMQYVLYSENAPESTFTALYGAVH